jgi:hypothetical protein
MAPGCLSLIYLMMEAGSRPMVRLLLRCSSHLEGTWKEVATGPEPARPVRGVFSDRSFLSGGLHGLVDLAQRQAPPPAERTVGVAHSRDRNR